MARAQSVPGLSLQASTAEEARIIARTRLEEMHSWGRYIDDPYQIRKIHNLRIAAKRLRYTLEIFANALPEACAPIAKDVEQIQEKLGTLHDYDVMIALLRLYLGSLDSGAGYEYALATSYKRQKGKFMVNPELVACVLDAGSSPEPSQRRGLELLLLRFQRQREEQYAAFRQYWYQLQARDFRREIISILDS